MKRNTYNSRVAILAEKYRKLQGRIEKAINAKRFVTYTAQKQQQLLRLLTRYESQLKRLGYACALSTPLLLSGPIAEAQGPIPNGSEFQVNTYTTSYQNLPSVAIDNSGDFVIVWHSKTQDGSLYGVYGQRYDNTGAAVGSEFQVNTYTTSDQKTASVAMDNDGDFVVVWESSGQDGDDKGIYGQRYNNAGAPLWSEFQVNTYSTSYQQVPSVAMDSDGDFVIVWHSKDQDGSSYGIYGQRYNNTGSPVGGEFQVNTHTTSHQQYPSVAMDSDGDFVVVWESSGQDGSSSGVFGQRYNNTGTAVGSEFQVNTYMTSIQAIPTIAMDDDGDFVVTWNSYGQDGDAYGVFAQRYDNTGATVGSEFQVNTYTTNSQFFSAVAMDSDGDFVVTWNSYGQDGNSFGLFAQSYYNTGATAGSEFQVNTYTTNTQLGRSVAMDSDGDFVVAWFDYEQDGDEQGVYAQRYAPPAPFVCGPMAPLPTTPGTYIGVTETLDGDGFTYYCDANNELLLAIKIPAGWTIPADAVQLKIGATPVEFFAQYCGATGADRCFVQHADGAPIVNRFWEIDESKITAGTPGFVEIKHFFTNDEYNAINTELTNQGLANLSAVTDVQLYNVNAFNVAAMLPAVADVKPFYAALLAKNGASTGPTTWVHSTHGPTDHIATFKLHTNLLKAGGGLGGVIK